MTIDLSRAVADIPPTPSVPAPPNTGEVDTPKTHLHVGRGAYEMETPAPDSLGTSGGGTPANSASPAPPDTRNALPLADLATPRDAIPKVQAEPAHLAKLAPSPAAPGRDAPPESGARVHFESTALTPDQTARHGIDPEIGVQPALPGSSEKPAAGTFAPPLQSAETGAAVVRQIIASVAQSTERVVEVSLAPEELGRLRMTLTTVEHGVSVAMQAERPETLDLIRRHIDQLARDFRDLGYSNISFSFGDRPQHHQQHAESPAPTAPQPQEPQAQAARSATSIGATHAQPLSSASGGLDLRL
ncbi:flagellar hook-length control protein FliK [Phaeovulum sp.]|uniref:flagellar hook-length control protein FliK n=1 Tax=Phaeovulum sp. TaxID=2934796 RepID=UPI0035674BE2